jgi:hypothetical protein
MSFAFEILMHLLMSCCCNNWDTYNELLFFIGAQNGTWYPAHFKCVLLLNNTVRFESFLNKILTILKFEDTKILKGLMNLKGQ